MISVFRKALGTKWPNEGSAQINSSAIQDYVKWEVKAMQNQVFVTWDINYLKLSYKLLRI